MTVYRGNRQTHLAIHVLIFTARILFKLKNPEKNVLSVSTEKRKVNVKLQSEIQTFVICQNKIKFVQNKSTHHLRDPRMSHTLYPGGLIRGGALSVRLRIPDVLRTIPAQTERQRSNHRNTFHTRCFFATCLQKTSIYGHYNVFTPSLQQRCPHRLLN